MRPSFLGGDALPKKIAGCILAAALLFSSCFAPKTERKRYDAQFLTLFNTITQIVAYGEDKEEFLAQVQFIHDELERYHRFYDIYNTYDGVNNLKTINDNAGLAPVQVEREIIDLLLFCKEMHVLTGGAVNVAMGSVLSIWHDYRTEGIDDFRNARLPPYPALEEADKITDIDDLIIDEEASTVYLAKAGMSLDVGSIAKGYAVERVSEAAQEQGLTAGLVSVGGNVRALGFKDKKKTLWNIGIRNPNPDVEEKSLGTVYVTDTSLVTSGVYQRYYTVDGKRYHHIIDPETLMPSEYFTAVTIICRDSGMADALSTALLNMPLQEGKALLSQIPDAHALWVLPDGSIAESDGFAQLYNEKRKIKSSRLWGWF